MSSSNSSCRPKCDPATEPIASALNNFITAFFGSVTKSCVNNQVVWTLPCDLAAGMAFNPRLPNEGLACYMFRLFDMFGLIAFGVWSPTTQYPKNSLVTFNGQGYISIRATYGEQPDTSPGAWQLYIASGPMGPPGASPLTTKGDIFGYDVADARIPVGADNSALIADSTQALGVRWGSPPSSDTASNLGAGNGVFSSKAGNDFQFKSLIAGTNITITPTGTDLTINSTGGFFTEFFESGAQVITAAGALTIAHGLSGAPRGGEVILTNVTGELGYTAGDVLLCNSATQLGTAGTGTSFVVDATNIVIRFGSNPNTYTVMDKTTGVNTDIVNAKWNVKFRVWR